MNISLESIQNLTNELINVKVALLGILFILIVIAVVLIIGITGFWRFARHSKLGISSSLFKGKASELLEEGKTDALISFAQSRLSAYPNSVTAYWYLGEAYYRQGNWKEAFEAFSRVLALDPATLKMVDPYIKEIRKQQGEDNRETSQ